MEDFPPHNTTQHSTIQHKLELHVCSCPSCPLAVETGAAQVDAGHIVGFISAEEFQPKETSALQRCLGASLSACALEGAIILDSEEICPLPWRGTLTQYSNSVSTQHPWRKTKAVGVFAQMT